MSCLFKNVNLVSFVLGEMCIGHFGQLRLGGLGARMLSHLAPFLFIKLHFEFEFATNRISNFGTTYYPGYILKNGTPAAKFSKAIFGTTRVFGIIGRASPLTAIGFAVFDIVSIGMCILEERNGR